MRDAGALIRAQGIAPATLEALLISKGMLHSCQVSERSEMMARHPGGRVAMLAQVDEGTCIQ